MSEPLNPPLRLLASFQETFPSQRANWILSVPGRDMWIAASIYENGKYSVSLPDIDGKTAFSVRSARLKQTYNNRPIPSWSRYLAGVAVLLSDADLTLPGADIVIAGEEPAGPRYEYSVGMAFAAMWYQFNSMNYNHAILLDLMEQVRRDYVDA